jgi:hypothetical protein
LAPCDNGEDKLDEEAAADAGFFKLASTDATAATGPSNATLATATTRERDVQLYLKVHHILEMLLLGVALLLFAFQLLLLHLFLSIHLFQFLLEFLLDACSLCISSRLEIHPFHRQ